MDNMFVNTLGLNVHSYLLKVEISVQGDATASIIFEVTGIIVVRSMCKYRREVEVGRE